MDKKENEYITSISQSIVSLYRFHGLNDALHFFYESLKKLIPICTLECIAKPYDALWFVKLISFPIPNHTSSQIKTFHSLMVKSEIRALINSQENSTCIITRSADPYFFEVNDSQANTVLCNFLLNSKRTRIYIYIYPQDHYDFNDTDTTLVAQILHPLTEELRRSFLFPSPFTQLPAKKDMESAASLLQLCPDLKLMESQIRRIASTDSLVLVTGESGTGKDLVAKTIHEYSARRKGPFVKVNCGAIPDTLLDSELFGYEKGAFTGAEHAKSGYFEQAEGGTIFLDEIGELSLAAQVRLLHVLENGQIQRVGSQETRKVNTRIIAATNRNLWTGVESDTFREDLCYRLFVCHVHVPPLCERRNDIPVLIWYFLNKKSEKMNIPPQLQIREEEIQALCAYDWPGNVRELEHTIERSLIYSGDAPQLNIKIHTYQKKRQPTPPGSGGWPSFDDFVADYLKRALEYTEGRVKGPRGAARLLRLNPNTLRSKLLKYGLLKPGHPAS